jgi:hypothetical protein
MPAQGLGWLTAASQFDARAAAPRELGYDLGDWHKER